MTKTFLAVLASMLLNGAYAQINAFPVPSEFYSSAAMDTVASEGSSVTAADIKAEVMSSDFIRQDVKDSGQQVSSIKKPFAQKADFALPTGEAK